MLYVCPTTTGRGVHHVILPARQRWLLLWATQQPTTVRVAAGIRLQGTAETAGLLLNNSSWPMGGQKRFTASAPTAAANREYRGR